MSLEKRNKNENDFRECNLYSVPEALYKFQNLQSIYLENNSISKLSNRFFEHFIQLKWLDLRKNKLENIPKTIQNHPALETLLLDDNKLTSLPTELGSIQRLKGLQVTNNPLEYPPENAVRRGVQHLIHFLQQEWQNREQNKNSTVNIKETNTMQECTGSDSETHSLGPKSKQFADQSIVLNKCNLVSTPSLNIGKYMRVKKLLRSKPETALTLFEFWDQLTPSHLLEKLNYTQLAKHEKKEDQRCFSVISTSRFLQQGDNFLVPRLFKYKIKRRKKSGKFMREKLKTKEEFERDVQKRHVECLQLIQQRLRLEKQDHILQKGKNKEALRSWRLKVKKQHRRDFKSQIWKILQHYGSNLENDKATGAGVRKSQEDFLEMFGSLQKEFQELNFNERTSETGSLEAEQRRVEKRIKKIHEIQRKLKELKL